MHTIKAHEDMTAFIGKTIRIEKPGVIYEGVLVGPSHVSKMRSPSSGFTPRWLLDQNGQEIHFEHPDAWAIHVL